MKIRTELWCEQSLMAIDIPMGDVEPFLNILRTYGFEDENGNEYKLRCIAVCPDGVVAYLDLVN